jgi:hypothetical protein
MSPDKRGCNLEAENHESVTGAQTICLCSFCFRGKSDVSLMLAQIAAKYPHARTKKEGATVFHLRTECDYAVADFAATSC